jgi:hypothetical protein
VPGQSDPTAWPLTVTAVTPTIWLKFEGGSDVCPLGFSCPPFEVFTEDILVAAAYLNGQPDPNPPAGTSWNFGSSAEPASGLGSPSASFRYTASGPKTITLTGYGTPVTTQVNVTPCSGCTSPTVFYTLDPCRCVDTRLAAGALGGPPLAPLATRVFVLSGTCGIPSGARAVSANVTVTAPQATGDLRLYRAGSAAPLASTINFRTGQTRANSALLGLSLDGTGSFAVQNDAAGTVDLVVDVNGYFK